ncbi:dolichyl-phosphate-mannose-protein mannosyltransferase [Albidovulum inexpectatum]|uniref:Dolichyl-phosphate-mannose-protein mannosyltransferase n=1 Tax=Albidovulum inexpectatum TaxID=196587 RepID=A0A2S5JDF4_9RHOB|nr:glycosyltransferase family 39 protein [Albidovulum inexpectatum]PPB79517.1 dolichyl-phosphate-mannose-protein mannosyltransferase [Albidovulum inexpectatum]
MRHSGRHDLVWLGAILALAAALRVWGLNAPLWHDEIQTLATHLNRGWASMLDSYSMNHHYLHNLLAKASISVLGDTPWAVRLPAMLFGLGTIAAAWHLARDIGGTRIAHVSALLLALSYHQIWFSQNARGYTALAFFSTLAMVLFLRGMRRPRPATWLGLGLCMAAAIFTHLTGAFFFVALGLVWLGTVMVRALRGRLEPGLIGPPLTGFLLGTAVTLLLYAPLVPSLIATVQSVSGSSAADPMKEYQSPLWAAFEAIRTATGNAGPLTALAGVAVLLLSLLGWIATYRDARLFAPTVFLHIAVTVALLMAVDMRIWPRFFFTDIAFLMILIVSGVQLGSALIAHLVRAPRLAGPIFTLGVIGMIGISAMLALRNYQYPKQDLKAAWNFAHQIERQGARVIAIGHAGSNFRARFGADWPVLFTDAEYHKAIAGDGPVVLVVGFPARVFRDMPQLAADAGVTPGTDICAPGHEGPVLRTLRCFPGTLGDGNVIVLSRD